MNMAIIAVKSKNKEKYFSSNFLTRLYFLSNQNQSARTKQLHQHKTMMGILLLANIFCDVKC